MADEVGADPQQSYDDPDIATIVADANCDELVKSLDPLYFVLVLVSRGLISKQQARDILNDRTKIKTRSERNLAFLNLVKSSPDPTWFSALLEALEEERSTERLKEVLEKSYRAVASERQRESCRGSQITSNSISDLDRKSKSSSSQIPAKRSKLSVTDAAAIQEPPSSSDHKDKSPKPSRQSLRLQQKRGSTSCGPPTHQPQQSVTVAASSQEPPFSSDQKGKSSSSQPSAKRSKLSVTDAAATQEPSSSSDRKDKSPKPSRQSLRLQQKRGSTSCGPPAHQPQQSVTDVAATQKPLPSSDQTGKSYSSQPRAKRSKLSVTDAAASQEPPSYSDMGPMEDWNRAALVSLQGELKCNIIVKNSLINKLQKAAGGFMDEGEAQAVESKPSNAEQIGELIRILLGKGNADFRTFCTMLRQSNYSVWADELERKAREFRRETDGPAPRPGPSCTDVSAQKVDDDTALLGWKPSFLLLQKSVVPRVSTNWKALGLNLGIQDSCLSAIEKSKPHQPDACCTEMFSMWLGLAPHTGGLPLTWSSVLSAVGKVDSATSEELLVELQSRTEAHLAILKLAGELEAYYNRLEPVVGDGFTPKSEFVELAVVERRKKEGLRKKKNFEEFLHATVNGIDEIYEKSHPVEYCQILTLEKGPTTGKHIIVSGAPGSGKTTLVRQLCKDLSSGRLQSGYTLVVLVELRELILLLQDKEEAQLHHFLTKFKRQVDIKQVCRELKKMNGRGVLLVLDGFDELDERMRGCQLLKKLLSTESNYLPDCDILVTSRPVTCPDLLGLMQPLHHHIEILGFSEDCIASFIRSYFKCTCQPPPSQPAPSQMSAEGGCEAEKLLSRLAQLPQVKGMCRTPVVLKIVCEVCQILGADDLPATMTGIYEAFIRRQLLENGPQGTEISSILQVPSSDYPFFSDLCRVAFECCIKQKLTISREDIGNTPPPFTRGSIYGLLFEDRVADLGAIRGLALYHFMHKTVQEALAACHLAALPDPKSHEEVWREWFGRPEMAEVWKFYCGLTGLKCVDISSIIPGKADTLLAISLFEAGSTSLAREELPRIFREQLMVDLHTSYDTAVYTFTLNHHQSVVELYLCCTSGSVNLQLLLDALFHHSTVRELVLDALSMAAEDRAALCQFLRGKHRLAKVELQHTPVEVGVAALSTESSTMEELKWDYQTHDDDDATGNLLDCLRSTSLRCITIEGNLGKMLLPILKGLSANTKTIHRTVDRWDTLPLDPSLMSQLSQLAELGQFLVPCVNCDLRMPLPVGVWGTLLSGVGESRRLQRLHVNMCVKPEEAGPEWDHIDQPKLEEVERSWAHSKCWEVEFDISDSIFVETHSEDGVVWRERPWRIMRGSTLDATMKLLCAVVKGIIQREDEFVLKLQVLRVNEQLNRLVELEDIARNKCAVTRTEEEVERLVDDFADVPVTVLELKPLYTVFMGKSFNPQPTAKQRWW